MRQKAQSAAPALGNDRQRSGLDPKLDPGPLASAFASTFVWALVLILAALIPAIGMALSGWRRPLSAPARAHPVVVE